MKDGCFERCDLLRCTVGYMYTVISRNFQFRHSIVASIPACHAGDRGSIPRDGVFLLLLFSLLTFINLFPNTPLLLYPASFIYTISGIIQYSLAY